MSQPHPAPLVVGVGAAAGGVEALGEFFAHVPAASGCAYVVMPHHEPEPDSQLASTLQAVTPLPVIAAAGRARLAPDHVYVVSAGDLITLAGGDLLVAPGAARRERRAPIDHFFRDLAEAHGALAVCVVLSGAGADGSMGLKYVKERGGAVFAQSPYEAAFAGMPRAAVATGLVDEALPVAAIPARVAAYGAALGAVRIPVEPERHTEAQRQALREIFGQLRFQTGHDFTSYSRPALLRRVERRISLHGLPDLPAYAALLHERPDEVLALCRDQLLAVTTFFRDAAAFAALEREILPELLAGRRADEVPRVWVAGCATGEEAYSIAMLCAEQAAARPGTPQAQIFATDIDEAAIARARAGLYSTSDTADVSPERLGRFFTREGEGYRVRAELRAMVTFAAHNVLRDLPFSRIDLALCRNLLHYLNHSAQERVLETLHFALRPGGHLFLGAAEATEGAGDLFAPASHEHRIFRRQPVASRALPLPERAPLVYDDAARAGYGDQRLRSYVMSERAREPQELNDDLRAAAEALETSQEELRSINEELRGLNQELRARVEEARLHGSDLENLINSADVGTIFLDRGLRVRLFTPAAQALFNLIPSDQGRPLAHITHRLLDVDLLADAEAVLANMRTVEREARTAIGQVYLLRVLPYRAADGRTGGVVITFFDISARARAEEALRAAEERQAFLLRLSDRLRPLIDPEAIQYEAVRTLGEHLGASRVGYAEDIGDGETIRVTRNYTDGVPGIEGRYHYDDYGPELLRAFRAGRTVVRPDIASDPSLSDAEKEAHAVLQLGSTVNVPLMKAGRLVAVLFMHHRTARAWSAEELLLLEEVAQRTWEAVERARAEAARRESEARFRLLVEGARDYAMFLMDPRRYITYWSAGAERVFGWAEAEVLGREGDLIFTPEDRAAGAPEQECRAALEEGSAVDRRWHMGKDGRRLFLDGVLIRLDDEAGVPRGFAKIGRDATRERMAEEAVERARDELEQRVYERTAELAAANSALHAEIAQRRQAEAAREELQRSLAAAQEEERLRIARDLHDQLGQQITGLQLGLKQLEQGAHDPEQAALLQLLQSLALDLAKETHRLAVNLRPTALDDVGLLPALEQLVASWSAQTGVGATFHGHGMGQGRLPRMIEIVIYRVVQEALTNVHKHTSATLVGVLVERRASQVVVIVEDNGDGFAPDEPQPEGSRPRLGLLGIRERVAQIGGTLEIEAAPGSGTTVLVRIPVDGAAPPLEKTGERA